MNLKVLVLSCLLAALAVSSTTIEKSLMDDLSAFIDSSDFKVSAQDILSAEKDVAASSEAEEQGSTFIETSAVESAGGEITDTSILMAMRDVLPAVVAAEKTDLESIFSSAEHPAFEITSFLEMDNEVDEEEHDAVLMDMEDAPGNGYQADGWAAPIISAKSFEGQLMTRGQYVGYPHPAEGIYGNADYYGAPAHAAYYTNIPVVRSFGIGSTPGGYVTSADMAGRSFMEVDHEVEEEEEHENEDEPFDWGDFNGEEEVDRNTTVPVDNGTVPSTDTPIPPTDTPLPPKEPEPPVVPPKEPEPPVVPPKEPEPPVVPPKQPEPPVVPPKQPEPPVVPPKQPEPPVVPPKNTTKPVVPPKNTTKPVVPPKKLYTFVPHVEYEMKRLNARFYPYYSRENGYNTDKSEAWNAKHAPKMDGAVIYQEPSYVWNGFSTNPMSSADKKKYIYTKDTPELPRFFPANMNNAKAMEPIHRELVVGLLNKKVQGGVKAAERIRDLTRVINKMDEDIQFPVETIQQYKD